MKQNFSDKKRIIDLPMLSAAEYEKVVRDFNDTAVDYPKEKTVHQLFEEQVERTPDSIALRYGEKAFTFYEVNGFANTLAKEIIAKGVVPGDIVAMVMKHTYLMPICIFAVLKAGAAYLPIDPEYPTERIEYTIVDAGCKATLTYGVKISVKNEINIDKFNFTVSENIKVQTYSDNMCIVIYTSGSTGKPKGTLIKHKGLVNYAYANQALYDGGSCVIGFSIYTFDAFFLDTILPMMLGICAVMATEKEQFNQFEFERVIKFNPQCNFFITPAKLLNFVNSATDKRFLSNVNKICIGGEIFPREILSKLNSEAQIYNVYGPTECSMWTTAYPIARQKVLPPPHENSPSPF